MLFFFFFLNTEFNGRGTCKAETNARAIEHCNKDIISGEEKKTERKQNNITTKPTEEQADKF